MALVGCSNCTQFENQVPAPFLVSGLLEPTVPDKLRSSKQRYRLTAAGSADQKTFEEEK